LWELVAAGLVTADGFDSLRVLVDPRRKQIFTAPARVKAAAQPRNAAGRWSMLCLPAPMQESAGEAAARHESQMESACMVLLHRYGVVFRDLMARETSMPRWRDLLAMFRRLEARGVVRGGRFVSGFGGEQFALPEALESLREMRRRNAISVSPVTYAAADPMNLVGIVIPGERPPCIPGKTVTYPFAGTTQPESAMEEIDRGFAVPASLFASQPVAIEVDARA
jgi:ATP-dependent Lhr-like helicase